MAILPERVSKGQLTPELIKNKLFWWHITAHNLHLETPSFEEHKALGKLWEALVELTDHIVESMQGYIGRTVKGLKIDSIPAYSPETVRKFVEEAITQSYQIYEWAEDLEYCDVENKIQDLSGALAKCKYMLTLK